jgi:Tfp pilus assembly protein PilO
MKSLAAVILFLAAIGLVFLVARPMWDEIALMRTESRDISDNLAQLKEVEALRDELLNTYNSISKDDLARLEEFLPSKPTSEDILVSMENLAIARGILLKNVNFAVVSESTSQAQSAVSSPNLASTITYNFNLTSSYEAFRTLVEAFEKSARLTDVSDIAFSSTDGAVYNIALKARSYYQK